jgi:hypothetical protein
MSYGRAATGLGFKSVRFLRNPMGSSDPARSDYAYDRTCGDLNDFSLAATPTSSR